MSSLSFSHLTFLWPDGSPVIADATGAVSSGLTCIVGANGAGKSTLLSLLAGDLPPASGTVLRTASLVHVPQDVALDASVRADAVMGLTRIRTALRAIQGGSVDPSDYDIVGDDWDAEERASGTLASLGLPPDTLDRTVGELSGGETTRLALASALHRRPDVLLLDEPTNNLDSAAIAQVVEALAQRREPTLAVSHDRALLTRANTIGELRRGRLRWFGGDIHAYEEALEAERATADQEVRSARADVARQQRELRAHVEGSAKRQRVGARKAKDANLPKVIAGELKRKAQTAEARVTGVHEDRLGDARTRLGDAQEAAERDREIRVELPDTEVPARRDVARLDSCVLPTGAAIDAVVQGPERIVIRGRNGSGKTTLLRTLLGEVAPLAGTASALVPVGYLPQRLDVLDPALTVVENVRAQAHGATPHDVRAGLARFLFRGDAGDALAATLSGGERLRATLAALLLARPAPQLLLLDEPTNNLDFASRSHLIAALEAYRGALVVVSHDAAFVASLAPTREWRLEGSFLDTPL
ncbi:ABC-F family ATP-binding cassette domain-containing protein [Demequina aestuarii]|uniref:ABC-F family ATP-binding cassette domain-containing protein n=1 Tax=Demequina aestuarii TaxID=327095 RepID=UPI000784776D|nr:ATP-binding cassette domain-containing protein [Demequina aestuarii]